MTPGQELTSNERVLAISLLVVGALVVLMSIPTIGGAIYTLSTGKVMGSDLSKSFMKLGPKSSNAQESFDRTMEITTGVQKRFSPWILIGEGAYLVCWAGVIVSAVLLLLGRGTRRPLGYFAIAGAGVRVGVGLVTYLMTTAITRATTETMLLGQPGMTGENAEQMQGVMRAVITSMTALTSACTTLLLCGYLAVTAWVFLREARPPGAPQAPA